MTHTIKYMVAHQPEEHEHAQIVALHSPRLTDHPLECDYCEQAILAGADLVILGAYEGTQATRCCRECGTPSPENVCLLTESLTNALQMRAWCVAYGNSQLPERVS